MVPKGEPIRNIGKVMPMTERERTLFGKRLFDAREAAGLKQEDVCERIGIAQGTLSGLERSASASRHTAMLAKIYGVDAHWLATGQGQARPVGGDNRTTNIHGTHEQWVYDGGYLYFQNGILTSIQN